jgi:hypothetical protein
VIPATCGNCNAPLTGPYCAQCGQHAHESARSLGALFHDAWHVVTHLDGRFWSTLRLLLLRPGQLTLEYFAERRARYVPPVRLYFVISIAFFITFFGLSSPTRHGAPAAAATGSGAQQPLAAELGGIKAEIKQAKKDGKDWDMAVKEGGGGGLLDMAKKALASADGKEPDVYVEAWFNGYLSQEPFVTTSVKKDTYYPVWNESGGLTLKDTDFINFMVWDKDPVNPDLIGECKTKPLGQQGMGEIKLENCGQVVYLVVKITKN